MTDASQASAGTTTFLFSDIEGSTRLEQAVGTARYSEIRERHRSILRDAFDANGGVEQGTEGDSFFVVFPSARQGIAAAVAAQLGLGAEAWPPDAVVRVRMGLHTGEAELAGGSLVGLDINRAARIAAVANGGQILASEATRALASASLPPGIAMRDLGLHRLRDLGAPQRLFQVNAAGLRERLPAASIPRRASEQPADPADHVHRPGSRDRRGGRAAVRDPPAELHGTRAVRARRGCRSRSRRRRPTRSRTASGSSPSRPSATRRWWPRRSRGRSASPTTPTDRRLMRWSRPSARAGSSSSSTTSSRSSSAGAVVADLLRRCPGLKVARDDAGGAPRHRRAGVPRAGSPGTARHAPPLGGGPAEPAARPARARHRYVDGLRGRPPVHHPRDGGQARLQRDECQRSGGGRHRRDAAWHAPRPGARRGADQAADPGPDPGPPRAPPGRADRRVTRPPGTPADPARRDRLEL